MRAVELMVTVEFPAPMPRLPIVSVVALDVFQSE